MKNVKRLLLDLALFVGIMILFLLHAYEVVPSPIQLLSLKTLLVSAALIHAHIVRKLLFPYVDLKDKKQDFTGGHYVSIFLYIGIPCFYALGG